MKKNSIFGFVGALLLGLVAVFTPYITKAQSPVLKASFVSTDPANFVAGKEVKADVKIENFSAKDATDLWYASGFLVEDGLEPYYLDVKEFKTGFAVKAKSALMLDTTYTVPTTAPKKGDVFLVALIYNGLDTVVGYAKQKITISGALETVLVDNVSLKTSNDKTFLPQEGPTLYNPAKVKEASFATGAQVVVKFSQKNPTSLTLYPQVNIVLWPENKEMFSQKLTNDKVVVNKDKSSEFVFNVPVFNYVPGVYEGKISFVDEQNKLRSEVIDFRYIVSGDMATIYNIVSDKDFGLKGEVVNLLIDIGGVPGDIQNKNSEKRTFEQHTISVNLKNEFNKVVGTKQFNVDAMETNVQLVPVTLTAPAKVLSAEVTIGAGEKILAYRQVFFGADYEKNKLEALKGGAMTWFLVIVGLLVIGLVVFFLIKKGMLKLKSTHLFILLALFSVPHFTFGATQVFNTRQDGDVGCPDPGVVVSYVGLADDQMFAPGETFTIDGTVQYKSCSNNTVNTNVEGYVIKKTDALTFPNQSKTVGAYNLNTLVSTHYHYPNGTISPSNGASFTFNYTLAQPFPNFNQMVSSSKIIESKSSVWANLAAGDCASTGCWRTSTLKNLGTFTAPTTPGEYRFYFYLKHKNGCYESYYLSYIDFKVKPATPSNLTASVGGLCSPDITLSWTLPTSMTGVEGFKLYRSTSEDGNYELVATIDPTETSYVDTLTSLIPGTFYYKLTAYDIESGLESDPVVANYIYPESCRDGLCKTPPDGSGVTSEPIANSSNLCAQGLLSITAPFSSSIVRNVSTNRDETIYSWNCVGTDDNYKDTCSANLQYVGVCASTATIDSLGTIDPSKMCSSGITSDLKVVANGYNWKCQGSDPSRDVACDYFTSKPVNGECGTKDDRSVAEGYVFLSTDLCLSGTQPVPSYSDNTYRWVCSGIDGGTNSPQCSAYTGVARAECVDYPQGLLDVPTNLCVSGHVTGSVLSYGSKYTWVCASDDETIFNFCSANKSGYGVCGDRSYPLNSDQSLLCDVGSTIVASPSDQGDYYEWQCKGANNNPDAYATCKAYKGPTCANGLDFGSAPLPTNASLCEVGTADEVLFNEAQNKFEWRCIKGGQTSSLCSATKTSVVPGVPAVSTRCISRGVDQHSIDVSIDRLGGSLPIEYLVYRSTQNSNDIVDYASIGSVIMTRPNSFNILMDGNVTSGTTYYYKVKARNTAGDSAYSYKVSGSATCQSLPQVPLCGSATNHSMIYMPSIGTPDLCNEGVPSNFTFDSVDKVFNWDCVASPSETSSCSAPKVDADDVLCGSAINNNFSSIPSITNPNLCNPGNPSEITEDSDGFSWKCSSVDSSVETTCSANKLCVGTCGGGGSYSSCGSAELVSMSSIPTENGTPGMCLSGSVVSGSISSVFGGYVWKCGLGSNTPADCFARKSGFVPPGVLCPDGDCSVEEGEVGLRDLVAYPAIGNKGYQCTIFIEDQANNYSVFEKRNSNTRCELTGPGLSVSIVPGGGQVSFPRIINQQSTYKLSCWQQNEDGIKDPSSERSEEITCKINPSYVETSFIKRLFSNIKSMSASAFNAFKLFFDSK